MTYFLVVAVLFLLIALYLLIFRNRRRMNAGKRSRLNFIFTIGVTLALTIFAVVYNNVILHNASVINVYENGEQEVIVGSSKLKKTAGYVRFGLNIACSFVFSL